MTELKALCIIDREPDIAAIYSRFDEIKKEAEARKEAIIKRVELEQKEFNLRYEQVWKDISSICKAKGWIDQHTDVINSQISGRAMCVQGGCLYLIIKEEKSEDGLPDELKQLLTALVEKKITHNV